MKETPGFIPKLHRRQSPYKPFCDHPVRSVKLGWTQCFLLKCTGGYLLIDTYYPKYYRRFERKLANLGIAISDIKYLLLTHHHNDHAGFAAELVRRTGCQVIAHRSAVSPLKKGKSEDNNARALNLRVLITFKFYEVFMYHEEDTYPPLTLTERDILLEGDNESFLRGIGIDGVVLHTPGHTHTGDSISVLLSDGNAFVGDAAMNFLWWCGIHHRPIAIGEINTVYESWRKLREHGARAIHPSHGKPFSATKLAALQSAALNKSNSNGDVG
ncbi:MAG: MBL fold metallo-hydrolase [Planctomycetota bacterium]|jgi:glyoxylase-like metal-dependent hydrolase (beta-lactamase superfamily II)